MSAGEEGPADELWEAINELKVERIDHGVSCLQDPQLMKLLKQTRMPLTVCPCSNYKVRLHLALQHALRGWQRKHETFAGRGFCDCSDCSDYAWKQALACAVGKEKALGWWDGGVGGVRSSLPFTVFSCSIY